MKIVSHVIKKQIFRAMIIGGFVGLLGVAIFLGVLQASTQLPLKINGSEVANNQSKTETIPTAVRQPIHLMPLCFLPVKQVCIRIMRVPVLLLRNTQH